MRLFGKIFLTLLFFLPLIDTEAQEIQKWKLQDLSTAIKNSDQPTIFNFWATFCKPCLEEMPYLQEFVKKYESSGLKLVLVSLDLPEAYPKIKNFASRHAITSPIVFLDETNADLFCPVVDSSWSGAIPASLFINNKTGYRLFFEDKIERQKLETQIQKLIAK